MSRRRGPGPLAIGALAAFAVFGAAATTQLEAQVAAGAGAMPDSTPVGEGAPFYLRMARSVVQRVPAPRERWDYTSGLVLDALDRVAGRTGDTALAAYVRRNVDELVQSDGTIRTYDPEKLSLDEIEEGRIVLRLAERTGQRRYRVAAAALREQLRHQPRTAEGGFWHKKVYPQQMWLDGVYMAAPFYAAWGRSAGDTAAVNDAARQVLLAARHLRDPATGLYRHAWDAAHVQPWADSLTGLSRNVWGRGQGWFAMALVDVLDVLPADHPDRGAILALLQDLAPALARVQDPPTGLWYQVLDQPDRTGNYLETSASAMFAYALARGARRGYLPARYGDIARRAFAGLVRERVRENADGTLSLTGICQVAGLGGPRQRDGSFAYYMSEPVVADDDKGVGPFIMAALELER